MLFQIINMNISVLTRFPFSSTIPILSPSPSNAIPTDAPASFTFSCNATMLLSTAGSGMWFGNDASGSQ